MKKLILPLIFLAGMQSSQSWALEDIEITGEVDVNAGVYSLPTSTRGDSVFSIPSLLLQLNVPLREGNLLNVTLEGAEQRDQSSKPFELQTREAYLDLISIFDGMRGVRLGLIPQPWQEAQYQDWDYRFLGPTSWVVTEKWKYLFYSDLGLSYMAELPLDLGEWALSVVNGQGRDTEKPQPHKEFALFMRFARWNPVMFTLGYLRGAYDKYDSSVNLRERILASVLYRSDSDSWRVGAEVFDAHDPADAMTELKMADNVDVSSLTGQSVHGQGASLYSVVGVGSRSELMIRWDYLNAAVGESGKDLNQWISSYAYQISADVKTAVSVDYAKYADGYGNGNRDCSKLQLAAQVLF